MEVRIIRQLTPKELVKQLGKLLISMIQKELVKQLGKLLISTTQKELVKQLGKLLCAHNTRTPSPIGALLTGPGF